MLSRANGECVTFSFEDKLRPDAETTVARLRRDGLAVELLSGDRDAAVRRVAAETGIETSYAGMSPQAKLGRVEEIGKMECKVLVVGDGINDAPALAAGFVSMAPSTASDIGRIAADIVFMGESLDAVTFARSIALRAQSIARQNFAMAIGYNLLAVPIAMAGLATPLIAAVAMSSSSLIVIANALSLGLAGLSRKEHAPSPAAACAEPVPVLQRRAA